MSVWLRKILDYFSYQPPLHRKRSKKGSRRVAQILSIVGIILASLLLNASFYEEGLFWSVGWWLLITLAFSLVEVGVLIIAGIEEWGTDDVFEPMGCQLIVGFLLVLLGFRSLFGARYLGMAMLAFAAVFLLRSRREY